MKVEARFKVTNWEETPFSEVEGAGKLTNASVTVSYSGGIEGEGKVEYLMVHLGDGSATFYGLERVVGKIAGRAGSFVFEHNGTFTDGEMERKTFVVPGSAVGDLEGLKGGFRLTSFHQEDYPFEFDYHV
jgi:hypothetical protein